VADLAVDIAGIHFRNPVIVASAPLTLSSRHIVKCIREGASGAVTKTVTYDPSQQVQPKPRMHVVNPKDALAGKFYSLYSIDLMSEHQPEAWASQIREARTELGRDGVIIASIAGRTFDEWRRLAILMEGSGADMLELNLSCPHMEGGELMGKAVSYDLDLVTKIVRAVKASTSIPVIGKLTPQGANPLHLARTMASSGIDALASTARFQGLVVDVETGRPALWPWFGGYGGPWQVPISLGWTAHIAMERLGRPILGSGGISTWRDALSFVLVGASAIQLCTAIMVRGHGIIGEINRGLEGWLDGRGFGSIKEAVGLSLRNMTSLGELERRKIYRVSIDESKCTRCGICVDRCPYWALSLENNRISLDGEKCDNCNFCVSLCPLGAMSLIKEESL